MTVSNFYPELKVLLKYTVLKIATSAFCRTLLYEKYWYSISLQLELKKANPKIQFILSNAEKCLVKGTLCRRKIEFGSLMGNPSNIFNPISGRQRKDGRRNTTQILNGDITYRQKDLLSLYYLHLSCTPSYLPLCSPSALLAFHHTSLRLVGNSSVIIMSI